jgi:hypothetical protein
MTAGLHTVTVYPDPSAGGWSLPLASNPYLTADAAGWGAGPFTNPWVWAGGAVTGGTHLVRASTAPVPRVAASLYRLRVSFTIQVAANVYWGVYLGTTALAASKGPYWEPADSVQLWDARANLAPGTYTYESTWDPTSVDPRYGFLGPFIQFTAGQVARVDSIELTYQGAGGWSAPIASNPAMTTDAVGWRAIPFGSGWTWGGGGVTSTNPAAPYQALGRDPAHPVARPATGKRWRVRAELTIPAGKPIVRVYLLCRFGRTANDAFQTAVGANAASLFTWRDLPPGTHQLEATFTPAVQPDPAFTFLSPQVTVDPTTAPVFLSSLELTYSGSSGVDLSCLVDEVTVHHGRDDSDSQPEASSATVAFTVTPEDPLPPVVDVGATVVVTTTTANLVSQRFVGRITDLALGWDDQGADTPEAGVGQFVAVGPLADMGRRVVGDAPWPQELDGARMARITAAAGVTLDPLFSDPGTVALLARDVDSSDALAVAHGAAESAGGVLWETRSGEIRYADADHRRGIAPTFALDACDVLVTPTWRRSVEGLVNEVSVGYGVAPEGGEQPRFVAEDAASITARGHYAYTAATELADLDAATTRGRLLLVRNSSPVWIMAALPVDVDSLDSERYAALLTLEMHSLVTLSGLPAIGTAPSSAALWVEGYRETLRWGGHELELVVSGYCRTAPPPRWDDVSPTWTWDTAPSELTWDDTACLGPPSNQGRWNDQPATLRWNQVDPAFTWDTYQ